MNRVASGGISTSTIIVVILLILKANDKIEMDWIWVFSPWWAPMALLLALLLLSAPIILIDRARRNHWR
jgi:hypothetical protein